MTPQDTRRRDTALPRHAAVLAGIPLSLLVLAASASAQHGARGPAAHLAAAPTRGRVVLLDSVRTVLQRGLAERAYPGAYAAVGDANGVLASVSVGHLDWAPTPRPDANTMWDLASLTKVIGTTTAIMQLWDAHKVALDAPVQRYLPEFTGPGKDKVTVRMLLTHSSGLPAWRPLYKEATSPAEAIEMVYHTPLDTTPGVRMVYSDLGGILLGKIVEHVSGQRLDRYLRQHVFGPLGMTSTMFNPPHRLIARIAPTERDPWRGRLIRGQVHDENAYFLGGVSGHAGLFSSGHDLARFAEMMLHHGVYHGVRIVSAAAVDTFTRVQDPALSNRALGWEVPDGDNSAGHRLSSRAFGHTGFTGTSIWMDPERNRFIILLTNRVDPTRQNTRIYGVRVALADAVAGVEDALGGTSAASSP